MNYCVHKWQSFGNIADRDWHSFDHIYQPLRLGRIVRQGQFFKRSFNRFEFSFPSPRLVASPRLKNPVCPTICPIAGGRIIGFIPFPRVLVLCEMLSVLIQNLNSCRRGPFPTTITITPRAPPLTFIWYT